MGQEGEDRGGYISNMARAMWSGSISFGLVNVGVKMYSAVREHAVHFHQVEKGTGARIRYEKISEKSRKEVAAKDIELGFELAKGRLVTIDPDQLDDLRPRTTRTIDIADFVDLSEIDPVFYDRTYWLAPDGPAADRPYALLVGAMEDRGQAGVGTLVMRNKQYLAAIRPREGALALSTMHFADEMVAQPEVPSLTGPGAKPGSKELKLAGQIIDSLANRWRPDRYKDTYTAEVQELITRQAKGRTLVTEEAPSDKAPILDLMAALEASLDAAGKRGGSPARSGSPDAPPGAGEAEASGKPGKKTRASGPGSTKKRGRTTATRSGRTSGSTRISETRTSGTRSSRTSSATRSSKAAQTQHTRSA
jgi:DNA end-binding protein Ku